MSKENIYASTAGRMSLGQIAKLVVPHPFDRVPNGTAHLVISEMMMNTLGNLRLTPEISLMRQMMEEDNIDYVRYVFQGEIKGNHMKKPPYFWHLPKFFDFDFKRDLPVLVDHMREKNPIGILFYTWLRGLNSPSNQQEYIRLLQNWQEKFPSSEGHVLTVHDYTIFELDKSTGRPKQYSDGTYYLNNIGWELVEKMVSLGYKISVELAAEGTFPPVACSTAGHLESFMATCKQYGFGLTIDTYNLWSIVASSGGMLDDYFPFLKKFIGAAQKYEVDINLVHYKPFNLNSNKDAIAPKKAVFSYQYLRDFLDQHGLSEVPICFEVSDKDVKDKRDLFMTSKVQEQFERVTSLGK